MRVYGAGFRMGCQGGGVQMRQNEISRRRLSWVAVKELNLSYLIGEAILSTMYTHSDSLN